MGTLSPSSTSYHSQLQRSNSNDDGSMKGVPKRWSLVPRDMWKEYWENVVLVRIFPPISLENVGSHQLEEEHSQKDELEEDQADKRDLVKADKDSRQ